MNDIPLISVIIPTYNRASLIKRSAQSVLNQTYKNLELIIVDDGSTDNTEEVINSIKDERIVYVKQQNQGCCAARNKGIDLAKGEYIAFQDSDDVWHSDKLEKQIETLKQNNADVVFCKIFKHGNIVKKIEPRQIKLGFLPKDILPINIFPQTLFGKKEIFLNNKFDENMKAIEDFEILLRIQKKCSIFCMNEAMVDYYVQPDSITQKNEQRINYLKKVLNNNKTFLTQYSFNSLELLAKMFMGTAFQIKDVQKRNEALDFVFSINASKKIKLIYFLNKIHFYEIRALAVKSVTIPTKNIILTLKKIF